jgi:hypothetical protein
MIVFVLDYVFATLVNSEFYFLFVICRKLQKEDIRAVDFCVFHNQRCRCGSLHGDERGGFY